MLPSQKPFRGVQLNRTHPLAKGLVGCWLFNETTGETVFDLSGNGNNGILENGVAWGNGGLKFDGVDDYVAYSNNPPIGQISFSAYFKTSNNISNQVIVGNIAAESYFVRYGTGLIIHDGSVRGIYSYNNNEWQQNLYYPIENNTWYHVVVTFDNGNGTTAMSGVTGKLYVDGILQAEHTGTVWQYVHSNSIGAGDQSGNYFEGQIDSVSIYNRALSAEDVAWLYREPYAMFDKPLSPALLYAAAAAGVPNAGALMMAMM